MKIAEGAQVSGGRDSLTDKPTCACCLVLSLRGGWERCLPVAEGGACPGAEPRRGRMTGSLVGDERKMF